jgi:hypothetical protein
MSNESVVSRVTRVSLAELQGQFEVLAQKHPNLKHLYAVHLSDADMPLPVRMRDLHVPGHSAMGSCQAGYSILMHGRWCGLRTLGPGPIQVWQSWFQGDGQFEFHALAERAGPQLEAFRVRLPAPPECIEILRRDSLLSEDILVLPDGLHRWPKVLHWLGWAGKVMPVERWAAYHGMEMPFDKWDESRLGSRPQSFYSIIDNLFLRSAAALEWMIDRIAEGDACAETASRRPDAHRPKVGRPTDTNEAEDRRIADAWKTKRYKSLKDLATTFGKTKPEIQKALDRHRHRAGKTKGGKSRQDH